MHITETCFTQFMLQKQRVSMITKIDLYLPETNKKISNKFVSSSLFPVVYI